MEYFYWFKFGSTGVINFFMILVLNFLGNTGVAVMLYDPRRSNISKIERESGVKFEHISAPQPADIAKAVGEEAAKMISQVSEWYVSSYVLAVFKAIVLC